MSSRRNTLKMYHPSSWWGAGWRDALFAGNGRIGAAVYGAVAGETIMLSHERLWRNSFSPELPDVSDSLGDVRALLDSHQPEKAAKIFTEAFNSRGYAPVIGEPFPLGDLKISQKAGSAFRDYERTLDMENGEVCVEWLDGPNKFRRRLFVSRTDDVIVLELSASMPGSVTAGFTLELHEPDIFPSPEFPEGEKPSIPADPETKSGDGFLYFGAVNDDGRDFGGITRILVSGGETRYQGGCVEVLNADRVLLVTALFAGGERNRDWKEQRDRIYGLPADYQQLFTGHRREHSKLFNSVSINLNPEEEFSDFSNEELLLKAYRGELTRALAEKMWAFGRYLLISGSYEEGLPLPLHGLWTGEWKPFWGFNMVNENLQMIYWQAFQGNLTFLLIPVFDYFESLMDDFRRNARNIYGCRGIFIPAPTAPDSGLLKTVVPHIIHWTGGAGWIAQVYFDYYLFTGDLDFLENRALPFILESARFYEDFFTVGEDGFFISAPSNSPENTPGNYWDGDGMSEVMETTLNASMDFSIAREVFTHLISSLELLGGNKKDTEHWKSLLKKIPGYQVNSDGAVREWLHPDFEDNYHHRHLSHIYPVFPGTELMEEDDPVLFRAFVTAVEKRLDLGLGEQSAWSLAHMANTFARMGEGERAFEVLMIFSRTALADNLFSMGNDWRNMGLSVDIPWAPFQIDANMGFTSAVQEMLLYSRPGMVKLLPALPGEWMKGSFRNMLCRGRVEVSLEWDLEKRLITGTFLSAADQEITVKFPGDAEHIEGFQISSSSPGSSYAVVALVAGKTAPFKVLLY